MALAFRFAARSDIGLGRYRNNQDSGYAGQHLLAVCDGMGGHAGGDIASSLTLGRLVSLDDASSGGQAVGRLARALRDANADLAHRAESEPVLAGLGTTATVLLRYDGKLALAHIGDSRAYLLRDGQLTRITRDHTFVQTLVDDGRITEDEAEQHPQRNIVTRVLSGHPEDEPDLSVREARVGDRYLLCSDGVTSVVSDTTIAETLADGGDPAACAEAVISMALRGGAADNVTCVVAEVVDAARADDLTTAPQVVGAAAVHSTVTTSASTASPAAKAAALGRDGQPADEEPADDDEGTDPRQPSRGRRVVGALAAVAALAVPLGGVFAAWSWSRHQYYVGAAASDVAIYRGLPQDLGPISMSELYERSTVSLDALPEYSREQVESTIPVDDLEAARAKVADLRSQSSECVTAATGTASPAATATATASTTATATPSTTATATPSPSATPTATPPATPDPTCDGGAP